MGRPLARRFITLVAGLLLLLPLAVGTAGATVTPSAEPSFAGPLSHQLRVLFGAIAADAPNRARASFFPAPAYVAMKVGRIPNPSGDYLDRLWAFYALDIGAYHQLLFGTAPSTLLRVEVAPADAQWIPAGVCENSFGYWHLPGVRLVYRQRGIIKSVAVASLISWRGQWYVIHLGPNPRPRNVGTVDDFLVGAGTPGPAGGC